METISDIQQLPVLRTDSIHVWGIHVPDILDRLSSLHGLLCADEQEKAARFHRECDRSSSIAARGALRFLLSAYTGLAAAEIEFEYSETGKPSLRPPDFPASGAGGRDRRAVADPEKIPAEAISFNVSHSGEWVVLAFGRDRQVGVDVEQIRRTVEVLDISARYFTPEEAALIEHAEDSWSVFFQMWARKEAYVKACGSGLFRELSSFSVPLTEGTLPDRGESEGWIFQRLEAGSKYAAAVVTDQPLLQVPCYDFAGLYCE